MKCKKWCDYIKGKRATYKWRARSCRNFKLTIYINIVETACGQPSLALGNPKDQANDIPSLDAIISNYKNHPSTDQIRKKCSNPKIYIFPEAKKEEINILMKLLNPKKATGPDGIPLTIIKLSADVIDSYLTNIINTI